MSGVAIASIVLGCGIVAARAPLLFFPVATLHWFEGVIARDRSIRMLGLVVAPIGGAGIVVTWGEHGWLATLLGVLAWVATAVAVPLLIALPGLYRGLAQSLLDAVADPTTLRVLGGLGVAFGVFLIWAGITHPA